MDESFFSPYFFIFYYVIFFKKKYSQVSLTLFFSRKLFYLTRDKARSHSLYLIVQLLENQSTIHNVPATPDPDNPTPVLSEDIPVNQAKNTLGSNIST